MYNEKFLAEIRNFQGDKVVITMDMRQVRKIRSEEGNEGIDAIIGLMDQYLDVSKAIQTSQTVQLKNKSKVVIADREYKFLCDTYVTKEGNMNLNIERVFYPKKHLKEESHDNVIRLRTAI